MEFRRLLVRLIQKGPYYYVAPAGDHGGILHEEARMAAAEGILRALEGNWGEGERSLAGLDDAILARRPTDQCNSIAWLLWHMTRVVDTFVHTRLQVQPQVWIRDGWYTRFGMDPDPDNRGVGWTATQVVQWVPPAKDV